MKGGNIQLAQQFGVFAAKHPARAERLLASLKPNSGTRAAGKALESVAAEADADFVLGDAAPRRRTRIRWRGIPDDGVPIDHAAHRTTGDDR